MSIPAFSGCKPGSYCSEQARTPVGKNNTPIYHRTVTTLTGKGPEYTGSTTETYIIKPNAAKIDEWVLAATTTDGGKTQVFTSAAGADVRQSMSPGGNLYKNTQAQVQTTLSNGGKQQGIIPVPGQSGSLEKINTEQQKKLGIISESTATNPEEGDGLSALKNFNPEDIQQQIGEGAYRKKYSGGRGPNGYYTYPIDRNPNQDYIKFTMYRYSPKKFGVSKIPSGTAFSGDNKKKDILGAVLLPIQPQISDSNRVVWGDSNVNAIQAILGAVALGAIKNGPEGMASAVDSSQTSLSSNKNDINSALATYFAGQAVGANSDFFTRVTGAILNPNLELLFQGPALRSFIFTFSMSAREAKEADEIKKIIRFFKQGMSVKRAKTNLFLLAPNVFDISYVYGKINKDPHPWINKIKTCALQDCSVNYTPGGNYATYEDGAMTQYDMALTFGEIDPIYDDDYEGEGKDITTEIGY